MPTATRPRAQQVLAELDVAALTTRIADPDRTRVVVVVTSGSRPPQDRLDANRIAAEIGPEAEVFALATGSLTRARGRGLPEDANVFGDGARTYPVGTGAGRVYPIDLAWTTNPYRAPIRFYCPGDDPLQVADQLEDDAYTAANLAGLTASRAATATVQEIGTVKGPIGRYRVLLTLERGGSGALLVDEFYAGVESERLLRPGQILTGRVERGHLLSPFQPDPIDDDPGETASAAYAVGDVVLARVSEVMARSGLALLHHTVAVPIRAEEGESDLRNLIAVDDVATLTVVTSDAGGFAAELADADAPTVPCIPVLPGGPPWLVEQDLPAPGPVPANEPEPDGMSVTVEPAPVLDEAEIPAALAPTPVTIGQHAQIAGLTAQIESLTALLDDERRKTRAQAEDASRARTEAQKLRRKVRSLEDRHRAYRDRVEGAVLFSDPEMQLRYDIEQTWLRRTPECERTPHPLAGYRLGPGFLGSLAQLEGISSGKVLDVLVEVLTDRAKDIPGRELHPLRESASSQAQRVRSDGANAWRCALQIRTPSARRLHHWRLLDGAIELDMVGAHGDGL